MSRKDETEKCWLEFVEGYLTCTFNHTAGALCLGNKCPYCHELECHCYEEDFDELGKVLDKLK